MLLILSLKLIMHCHVENTEQFVILLVVSRHFHWCYHVIYYCVLIPVRFPFAKHMFTFKHDMLQQCIMATLYTHEIKHPVLIAHLIVIGSALAICQSMLLCNCRTSVYLFVSTRFNPKTIFMWSECRS
jgi:hypothetical protein